jgi:hypothetical protein
MLLDQRTVCHVQFGLSPWGILIDVLRHHTFHVSGTATRKRSLAFKEIFALTAARRFWCICDQQTEFGSLIRITYSVSELGDEQFGHAH